MITIHDTNTGEQLGIIEPTGRIITLVPTPLTCYRVEVCGFLTNNKTGPFYVTRQHGDCIAELDVSSITIRLLRPMQRGLPSADRLPPWGSLLAYYDRELSRIAPSQWEDYRPKVLLCKDVYPDVWVWCAHDTRPHRLSDECLWGLLNHSTPATFAVTDRLFELGFEQLASIVEQQVVQLGHCIHMPIAQRKFGVEHYTYPRNPLLPYRRRIGQQLALHYLWEQGTGRLDNWQGFLESLQWSLVE